MDSEAVVVGSFGTESQQKRLSVERCVELQLERQVYGRALHSYIRRHISEWQFTAIWLDLRGGEALYMELFYSPLAFKIHPSHNAA